MLQPMNILKALADESRVRTLMVLRGRELCVCQIIELLGLAPSTVSKHMAILKQARLVESRKVGRWIHYRRADTDAPREALSALAWLDDLLRRNDQVRRDRARVADILKRDPEELCRTQARKYGGLRDGTNTQRGRCR